MATGKQSSDPKKLAKAQGFRHIPRVRQAKTSDKTKLPYPQRLGTRKTKVAG